MTLETIFQNVTEGKAADVEAGVQAALDSGVSPEEILNKALIAAMDDVGERFEAASGKPVSSRRVPLLLGLSKVIFMILARTWSP